MNRAQFMTRLRELLSDISESEREEALNYYEGYFDDAGEENEQEVIASLGSPEKVARTIKEGLNDGNGEQGEFSETGFQGYDNPVKDEVGQHTSGKFSDRVKGLGTAGIVLVLILAIFALPILGPVCVGIISLIFGIVVTALTLLFALAIGGIALLITAVALFALAIPSMFAEPIAGAALFGASFLLAGIGILLTMAGIWVICKLLPPFIRWIVSVLKKPFQKKEA